MRLRTLAVPLALAGALYAQAPRTANQLVPSEQLNAELPAWLKFNGNYQGRLEGFSGGGYKDNSSDAYFLNRFRLNMAVTPSPWLKFRFEAQDSRVWGKNSTPAPPFQDTLDLRQAYVEVGNPETKTFGLRAGRQELVFGDQRLIGHLNWTNTARSFDAVRATFRHGGVRVDAFASSVVQQVDGQFDRALRNKGDNLHGIYGSLTTLVPKATIEPYVLWRLTRGLLTESGAAGNRDFKTWGLRFVGKLPANVDYNVEMARQTGRLGSDAIGAWAGHWSLGYTTPGLPGKPRWILEYNYASGDRSPNDGRRGTFDQLYPTGHDKTGLADRVGWRNIHNVQFGAQFKPHPKWTLVPRYHSFWLASRTDALYAANGVATVRDPTGAAGRFVGQELDFTANYVPSSQMSVGMGFAHLFPGTFLKNATPGRSYNFPYLMVGYSF